MSYSLPLMSVTKKTDPTDIRINNRMMIFSLLFPSGTLSRAEMSRRTSLSRVSVSEVVCELIDHHFFKEVGPENSSHRGKKGSLVSIDTEYWNIISLDLSQPYLMKGAVTDLLGQVRERIELTVESENNVTPDAVTQLCQQLIEHSAGEVLGIGVGVPGIVDNEGTILDSRNIGWFNLNLGALLEECFGYPVVIDNDTNSAILTERFFAQGTPNTMLVQVSTGVGAALLIDDDIVLGTNHAAGEIGHVTIDPQGPKCVCGKRGCLEELICAPALRRQILLDEAHKNDILQQAGGYLGQALATPAGLLDLSDIVVYGPADLINSTFLNAAEHTLNELTSPYAHSRVTVRRCQCGEDIIIQAESISVLQKMLRRF